MRALERGRDERHGGARFGCLPVRTSLLHAEPGNRLERLTIAAPARKATVRHHTAHEIAVVERSCMVAMLAVHAGAAHEAKGAVKMNVDCVAGRDSGMRDPTRNGSVGWSSVRRLNELPSTVARIFNKNVLLWVAQ